MSIAKRIGIVSHAWMLGWVYPIRALFSARAEVPIHRKITYTWAELLRRRRRRGSA